MRELLQRFDRFTSHNDGRALIPILRSVHAVQLQQTVPSDYIGDWLHCYREQLNAARKTIYPFLARCREFTNIIASFNRFYVLQAQSALAQSRQLDEHFIDQLEEFREEFSAYLRDVEQWANSVRTWAEPRLGHLQNFWQLMPTANFERVKTFRRGQASTGQ